jgi:hypothetical protein
MAKTEKVSVPRLARLPAPTDAEILSSDIMFMQPILSHYARIPLIVKNQPWLFDSRAPAVPTS